MQRISTTHYPGRHLATALLGASLASLWLVAPAAAQYADESAAIKRCSGELEFMISRDNPGRNPEASIDDRRTQVRPMARGEFEVSGSGQFMRDNNDRGRPFTFRCTVDVRSGRVAATYQWSGRDLDSEYDRPRPSYPQSRSTERGATNSPEGRVWLSGGIISRSSGKGLDVQGRSTSDAASIQQWPYGGNPNQSWDVIDLGRGEYAIVGQGSDKVLDVSGRGDQDGSNVVQNRWTGGDTQRWRFERGGGGGFYQVINVGSGKCLDVTGQSKEDGANIQLWSCSGGDNQAWRIDSK